MWIATLLLLSLTVPITVQTSQTDDFFAAVRKGDAKAVEEFLKQGVDVNAKWRYDQTALFPACDRGHIEVVKVLLAHGANVNVKDTFYGATPLDWAINHDHAGIVKLLVEKGLKAKGDALTYGVTKNHPEVVRAVIDAGVEAKSMTSALRRAKSAKQADIVEMLTKAGAVVPPDFPVDAETFASYAGNYKAVVNGPDLSFAVRDGRLTGGITGRPPLTLYATTKASFGTEENDSLVITFKVEEGKVTGLLLEQNGTPNNYKKVEAK